jgi:hypothetical protein
MSVQLVGGRPGPDERGDEVEPELKPLYDVLNAGKAAGAQRPLVYQGVADAFLPDDESR